MDPVLAGAEKLPMASSRTGAALCALRYVYIIRHMDIKTAIKVLAALAQDGRLAVFRLLVRAGAGGMPAGGIARTLEVPHNTLSAQLNILANAGLVRSRRDGRSIIYSAEFGAMQALLGFLMEDCCQGNPEACSPMSAGTSTRSSP